MHILWLDMQGVLTVSMYSPFGAAFLAAGRDILICCCLSGSSPSTDRLSESLIPWRMILTIEVQQHRER